jgi:hypothetical protein
MKLVLAAAAAAALSLAAGSASASIIAAVDPTAPFYGSWENEAASQNFLMQVTLGSAASVDGFDIYTLGEFAPVGQSVTIRIRNDAAGEPAAANLFEFTDTIDTVTPYQGDEVIAGAHFAPLSLAAGMYWIGMSGTSAELGWNTYANGGVGSPSGQRQLSGEVSIFQPGVDTFAWRLEGGSATPEPAAWALMLIGFGAAGAAMRAARKSSLA